MGTLKALDPILEDEFIDRLYQDEAIVGLVELIKSNITPPFSVAVSGSWGTGKTMLLKLIQTKLDSIGYPTLWFNPWEYDKSGDAVLALIKHVASEFRNRWKLSFKKLGIFGLTLAVASIDTIAKVTTKGVVSYQDVKNMFSDVKQALEEDCCEEYKDAIAAIKDDFVSLTEEVSNQSSGKSLIVFLDDLDRCLPDNALQLLDAVKNLFVTKNAQVIFISGIDTNTAKTFIRKRYEGMAGDFSINYFRKVFNLTLELPYREENRFRKYLSEYIQGLFLTSDGKAEHGLAHIIDKVDDVVDKTIMMAHLSGTKSLRTILNTINNYFVMSKTNLCKLDYAVALSFLFLRENWNECLEQMSVESERLGHVATGALLECPYVAMALKSDPRLKHFWEKFIDNETSIDDLRKARLL